MNSTPSSSRTAQRSWSRTWLFRLLAVAGSICLTLLLIEIALWIFLPIPYHQFMVWRRDGRITGRAEPGQEFTNLKGAKVRINQLGFRGPEYEWNPPAGTLRILAFGGSSTFNYHAGGEEKTWPGQVRKNLEAKLGVPVQVINLGLPGFDLTESKINYLFLGRQLHPHVVLVYHTWNDMKKFRNLDRGKVDVFGPVIGNKPLWQLIARNSQTIRRIRNALDRRKKHYIENQFTSLEREGENAHKPVGETAWEWFDMNFRDVATFANNDGVLPVLISQATMVQQQNLEKLDYRVMFGLDAQGMTAPILHDTWLEANGHIAEVAEQTDALFIDGRSAVPPDFEHMTDRVHLTDLGCEVLGKHIAEQLVASQRIQEIVESLKQATPK